MPKIITWTADDAKRELTKRLAYAKVVRKNFEYQWEECERSLYNTRGKSFSPDLSISFESEVELGVTEIDQSNTDVGINYAFKNFRFIHSQLSANPPTVVIRPTSNDPSDRRKADAADRLVRYAIRQYTLQDLFDRCTANVLQYGTGFIKTLWDPERGDIMDTNMETGEVLMDGDIAFTVPSPWDIFVDADASCWEEVKYVFERLTLPYEEALFRFPGEDKKDILERVRIQNEATRADQGTRTALEVKKLDVVEVYQYWEKGLPYNGMIGKFCYCTKEGELLSEVKPNPHVFPPPSNHGVDLGQPEKKVPGKAMLPYHIMTDIDIPNFVWGRSVVSYEAPLQDLHNRVMNVIVDNLQAHGVARIILPEGAEIADGSITNSPWDIIKITGTQPPHFMAPMPLPNSINEMINMVKTGIDDMAGVNEAMFGQQSREQSGFSMQYATNQGNMIRRRLFNKYVQLTENVYRAFLSLVRKMWTESRTIYVLGKEKAFEAMDIKGMDIDGGFDIVVEYGASLSLDPTTRREEILTLLPLFEKAGVETRTILQMLKLNELEGAYDFIQLAADRQREIFEEIIATNTAIPPKELSDHKNMLMFAYQFVMTTEYKYLPEEIQALINQHIKEREAMAAQGAQAAGQPGQEGQPSAGGLVGQPQQLPTLPGSTAPLDVTNQGPGLLPK